VIGNLGDAYEALEECFAIIFMLADGNTDRVSWACEELGFPDPWDGAYEVKKPMCLRPGVEEEVKNG